MPAISKRPGRQSGGSGDCGVESRFIEGDLTLQQVAHGSTKQCHVRPIASKLVDNHSH